MINIGYGILLPLFTFNLDKVPLMPLPVGTQLFMRVEGGTHTCGRTGEKEERDQTVSLSRSVY